MKEKHIVHIVLVEDEQALAQSLTDAFEGVGYQVTLETDGEKAFDVISENKPDLIILDMMLPGKTGTFILQEVRYNEQTAKIPVMVLSNISEVSDIEERIEDEPELTSYLLKSSSSLKQIVAKAQEMMGGEQ